MNPYTKNRLRLRYLADPAERKRINKSKQRIAKTLGRPNLFKEK